MESATDNHTAFTPLSARATFLRERARWSAKGRKAARSIERGSGYFLPSIRYASFGFFLIGLYLVVTEPGGEWSVARIFFGAAALCFCIWYPIDKSMGKSFKRQMNENRLRQERVDQGFDVARPGDLHRNRRNREARELGALAEQRVAEILDQVVKDLGDGLRVLHNLPKDSAGDIDHVLYSPYGVLIVETKANRTGRENVEQIRHHQSWFRGRFGEPTSGVCCVVFQDVAPRLIEGVVEVSAHRLDEVVVAWHENRRRVAGEDGWSQLPPAPI